MLALGILKRLQFARTSMFYCNITSALNEDWSIITVRYSKALRHSGAIYQVKKNTCLLFSLKESADS